MINMGSSVDPNRGGSDGSATNEHSIVLEWVVNLEKLIVPSRANASKIASNGHLEIFKCILNQDLPLTCLDINNLSGNSSHKCLKIFVQMASLRGTMSQIENGTKANDQLSALSLMAHLGPPVLPDEDGINRR